MDSRTQSAYSLKAQEYSQDWLAQPEPSDMYELLKKYFIPVGQTADIGCGNGRDANWLAGQGFKVTGYDSSEKLIQVASELFPHVEFKKASLPTLAEIQSRFDNVICETVIMHLPLDQIKLSILSLKRILKYNGILYLSWRVTENQDTRHADGRLYTAFDPQFIIDQFEKSGILHFEDKISASSGKRVCRLIFQKKNSHPVSRINVVGTSGSGKSTYGKLLASKLNCPYIEMDQIFWGPNWQQPTDEVFFDKLKMALDCDRWVLDGNYTRSIPVKWKQIDMVVWLDYSFSTTLFQSVIRAIRRILSGKEIWEGTGNRETFSKTFFSKESILLWMINTHQTVKLRYQALLSDPQYAHIQFVRLKSRKEADEFLNSFGQINE